MTTVEPKSGQQSEGLSFETFFVSTFPRARAVAARIVGPGPAEDLAVEGLARAYARWKTVAKMEYPEAWVMRVVTNASLDEIRRKKAYLPSITIADVEADLTVRANVVEALRTLPRRQQEVVVLRYIVDLPEAEVGRILGMSMGTVKTHLHRAMPRLRTHMTQNKEDSL